MVVDASVVGAIIFLEADGPVVAQSIGSRRMLAPTLLPFELASIAVKKIKRGMIDQAVAHRGLRLFDGMDIELMLVDPADALETAQSDGLSAYDASYLWLARRLGTGLATLDRRLAAAAGIAPIGEPT